MAALTAYQHLQAIRARLPVQPMPTRAPEQAANILAVAERYDVFFFDAFGVLNVGALPIAGAVAAVSALRQRGKHVFVVSNAASVSKPHMVARFHSLGFDFAAEEIVTSRDTVLAALAPYPTEMLWGLIGRDDGQEDLAGRRYLTPRDKDFFTAPDGFLFLATSNWNADKQRDFTAALHARPRPIILGNPDLISPMEGYDAIEPGSYVLLLEDALFQHAIVCGKPFANIFNVAAKRLHHLGHDLPHHRTLMCGDTLHTDILGANAFGIHSALISNHGFFRGLDYDHYIADSGIVPDLILPQL